MEENCQGCLNITEPALCLICSRYLTRMLIKLQKKVKYSADHYASEESQTRRHSHLT